MKNMKLSRASALVLCLALINITCGQAEQVNPTRVRTDAGKVNGRLVIRRLNIPDEVIEPKHAYAVKIPIGLKVLLTDDAIPKTTLQSFKQSHDRRLPKDFDGIFFTLNSSGKELGLFTMQYSTRLTTLGTVELAALNWKVENGRVIGEAKYPKDGDKSEKSFAVRFDAPIEN
jgi:hypothetical protein